MPDLRNAIQKRAADAAGRVHTVQKITQGWTGIVTSRVNHAYLDGDTKTVCGQPVESTGTTKQGATFDTDHLFAC